MYRVENPQAMEVFGRISNAKLMHGKTQERIDCLSQEVQTAMDRSTNLK